MSAPFFIVQPACLGTQDYLVQNAIFRPSKITTFIQFGPNF